jgi:starch phosphorylase
VRPAHLFHVVGVVPESLRPLEDLARNLHWAWDRDTATLFDRLDGTRDGRPWRTADQHPFDLVRRTSAPCWDALSADADFVARVHRAADRLDAALHGPSWFDARRDQGSPLDLVAYFSPEFGIAAALPQYSGGLGVLAGDHLKASSDLGVPLVGVGLLYAEGYFHQQLDGDGWQEERNERMDPDEHGLIATDVQVTVDLAGVETAIRVWRADVGRIQLYLLDTNLPGNAPEAVAVTDRLYGGDVEHRLRQEIVLGVGGVRALRALGLHPTVFHMNEGHAGFLGLERVREWIEEGLCLGEAVEAVRSGAVFTTHTPVPAGIDRFPRDMFERYFRPFAERCGVDVSEIAALGESPGDPGGAFNMAVMGLRLAARRNGVARLHGAVSREMFGALWPGLEPDETPIGHVTNGVHARTWVSDAVDELLTRVLGEQWHAADEETWSRVHDIDPAEIWTVRRAGRIELIDLLRELLDVEVLDPDVLTIGFARRFATYKRATLLLSQPDRLRALLVDPERPVQFVFAGKAHPADQPGKALIQQLHRFAREAGVGHRFVFVPDYDIAIARTMYHGCDVWLNTPRRPLEACGTSGMKAALNGVLNCSIRDGWWDEMSTGDNGWDLPSFDHEPDAGRRDQREADAAVALLEHEVIPLFHDRTAGVPRDWVERIAANWSTLGWNVTAARMVREYVTELYEPAAASARRTTADDARGARTLAAWTRRVADAWDDVRVDVEPSPALGDGPVGEPRTVTVRVDPGPLDPHELVVQLVLGPVGSDGDFDRERTVVVELEATSPGRYTGTFRPPTAGPWGMTARALPRHDDLSSIYETGLAASG